MGGFNVVNSILAFVAMTAVFPKMLLFGRQKSYLIRLTAGSTTYGGHTYPN
jgi:hypothetical protein